MIIVEDLIKELLEVSDAHPTINNTDILRMLEIQAIRDLTHAVRMSK